MDAVFVIPKDGSIALTLIEEANKADIPIGIFNRPPQSEDGAAIVVQADNRTIARDAVQYIADEATKLGRKVTPLILVGDLGDPNAVGRYEGFYDAINANADLFNLQADGKAIEVQTKWDAATAQANLQAAMTANPEVDFIFTSSDFLFPTIQGILEPMGKWVTRDDPNHVLHGRPRRRRQRLPPDQGRLRRLDGRPGPLLRGRADDERSPRGPRHRRDAA